MNWKEKMNIILKDVLGKKYRFEVMDLHNYSVYHKDLQIMRTQTAYDISCHWKEETKRCILIIINERILSALKKIN